MNTFRPQLKRVKKSDKFHNLFVIKRLGGRNIKDCLSPEKLDERKQR